MLKNSLKLVIIMNKLERDCDDFGNKRNYKLF